MLEVPAQTYQKRLPFPELPELNAPLDLSLLEESARSDLPSRGLSTTEALVPATDKVHTDFTEQVELIRELPDFNPLHDFGHAYQSPRTKKRTSQQGGEFSSVVRMSVSRSAGSRFRPEAKVLVRGGRPIAAQKQRLSKLSRPPRDLYKEQEKFLGERKKDHEEEDGLSDGDRKFLGRKNILLGLIYILPIY